MLEDLLVVTRHHLTSHREVQVMLEDLSDSTGMFGMFGSQIEDLCGMSIYSDYL